MTAQPLLDIRGLSVTYRRRSTRIHALQSVDMQVGHGETVGLVGESGSGKSTVGRAILGLAPVGSGSVSLDGRDITHLGGRARRALASDVQMVFQDPYSSLNPSRTIGSTLAEPLEATGQRDRATVRRRVAEMLERVRLPAEAANRLPREFSGGQRQRIAIARALIVEPKLVICDEAVSALDLSVQAQIINLLRELQAATQVGYLFISHDLEVVRHLSERVVVLYRGQVMEVGSAAQVSGAPAHPYTHVLHAAAPVPNPRLQRARRHAVSAAATRSTVVGPAGDGAAVGCPFAARCPYAEDRCRVQRPVPRPTSAGGVVACHRYPAWREEAPELTEVGSDTATALGDRWTRLQMTTTRHG